MSQLQLQQQQFPLSSSQIFSENHRARSLLSEGERKIFEDHVQKKKDQLYLDFARHELILKQTNQQLSSRNDVQFKQELDRLGNLRAEKEKQLCILKQQFLSQSMMDSSENQETSSIMTDQKYESQQQQQSSNIDQNVLKSQKSHKSQINYGSVFSKSFYPSKGIPSLPVSQIKSKVHIEELLEKIKQDVLKAEENLKNEEDRTYQLNATILEISKSKQKLQSELNNVKDMNDTSQKRFSNLSAIQYKTQEKTTAAQRDLAQAKAELKEFMALGETANEKQRNKMISGEKMKRNAEDAIAQTIMRQEELLKEKEYLEEEISNEKAKQSDIVEKRSESKYVLQYIGVMNILEQLFFNGEDKKNKIKINAIYELISQDDHTAADIAIQKYIKQASQVQQDLQTPISNSSRRRSSLNQTQEDNRVALINAVNNFSTEHPDCAKELIDKMIKMYNKQLFRQKELATQHSHFLAQKTRIEVAYKKLQANLNELRIKNEFVEQMQQNPQMEQDIMESHEAMDAGIILIDEVIKKKNLEGNKGSMLQSNNNNHQNNSQQSLHSDDLFHHARRSTSTLNILKMEDFGVENEKTKILVQANHNFLASFFLTHSEGVLRLCQMLQIIWNIAETVCPVRLYESTSNTIKYIKNAWEGKNVKMRKKKNKDKEGSNKKLNYQKQSQQNQLQIRQQEALPGNENDQGNQQSPSGYFKRIQSDKFSLGQLEESFSTCFTDRTEGDAKNFYAYLKSERIVWAFTDIISINKYLKESALESNGNSQSAFKRFEELKKIAVMTFKGTLQELSEHTVETLVELKQAMKSSLRVVHSFLPNFDATAMSILEDQHQENANIKEAKRKVIIKNLNYLRNTEPLMEDIMVKKEEEVRLLNEDQALNQGKDNNKQKNQNDGIDENQGDNNINISKEGQGQQSLSQLMEYIKNQKKNKYQYEKSNGVIDQHKQQQQQQEQQQKQDKNKGLNVYFKKQLKETQSVSILQHEKQDKMIDQQEQTAVYAKNQQQPQQNQQTIQQQQQQQQFPQSCLKQYRVEWGMHVPPGSRDEVQNYTQFTINEEQNLLDARELIRGQQKRAEYERQKLEQEEQDQKKKKFFVSNEISRINERLFTEHLSPVKTATLRSFSERQLVLSKIDRIDGTEGSLAAQQIVAAMRQQKVNLKKQINEEAIIQEINYKQINNQQYQPHYMLPNAASAIRNHKALLQTIELHKSLAHEENFTNYRQKAKQFMIKQNQGNSNNYKDNNNNNNLLCCTLPDESQSLTSLRKRSLISRNRANTQEQEDALLQRKTLPDTTIDNTSVRQETRLNTRQSSSGFSRKMVRCNSKNNNNNTNNFTNIDQASSQLSSERDGYSDNKTSCLSFEKKTRAFSGFDSYYYSNPAFISQLINNKNEGGKGSRGVGGDGNQLLEKQQENLRNISNYSKNHNMFSNISVPDFLSARASAPCQLKSAGQTSYNDRQQYGQILVPSAQSVGPYSSQNLKFYERYATQEGEQFFDSLLSGPYYETNRRPRSQQAYPNGRQDRQQMISKQQQTNPWEESGEVRDYSYIGVASARTGTTSVHVERKLF